MAEAPRDFRKVLRVLDDPCWEALGSQYSHSKIFVVGSSSSGKASVIDQIRGTLFPLELVSITISLSQSQELVVDEADTIYLANESCLILAVVDGSKDIGSNKFLEFVSQNGWSNRVVGVLTKPDLIQGQHALGQYLDLINTRHGQYDLPLGCYVLRNRSQTEIEFSQLERDEAERDFFSGTAWTQLPASRKGVESLRVGLIEGVDDLLMSETTTRRQDAVERKQDVDRQLSDLPGGLSSVKGTRSGLFHAMAAVDSDLEAAFVTPATSMGQAPSHGGSWVGPISNLHKDIEKLMSHHLKEMVVCGTSPDGLFLSAKDIEYERGRAEYYLRKYPAEYGAFPTQAARALFARLIPSWTEAASGYVFAVGDAVAVYVDDCVYKRLYAHLNEDVHTHVTDPAVEEMRLALVNMLPEELCHSKSGLPSRVFSRRFVESIDHLMEQRRRDAIRAVVADRFGIAGGEDGPLPTVATRLCTLEELSRAVEQVSLSRSFTADDIMIAVNQLRKVRNTQPLAYAF
ncbi:hypothetical protein ES702_00119 [subsurface metagenome]